MSLSGKTVVLGVTGGIAAYKACDLVSRLKKQGASVHVIMTKAACEFVKPMTFEVLSGNRVVCDMFDRDFPWEVTHISLAKAADVFAIVPATANCIGKLAHGIADDMLSTTAMATKAPLVLAPAMNTGMYENPAVCENIESLKARGVQFVEPACGHLACGDTGRGKLADVGAIEQAILSLSVQKDMTGLKVLVTAGPTREALDPVRFISNHSTGKMGYAIAQNAVMRGAEVTVVSGPVALEPVSGATMISVVSALEMREAVLKHLESSDIIIKAAAVGDYRPAELANDKLKKKDDDMSVKLVKNPDILKEIGSLKKENQVLCGFSMETKDLIENSTIKLKSKNCDLMVANNLKTKGAGFASDTNVVTLLYPDGRVEAIDIMEKKELSALLLDKLLAIKNH